MDRRSFIKTAAVGGLGLAVGRLLSADPLDNAGANKPNILYIFTDQQFAEALSCAGNPWVKTPAMDSLAAKGIRFNLAYASHPMCAPTRSSMMTGLMPHVTGVTSNGMSIRPEFQQQEMGWWFQKAGYHCAYAGRAHLPNVKMLEPSHGFDVLCGVGDSNVSKKCAAFLATKQDKPFLLVASFLNPHDINTTTNKAAPTDAVGFPDRGTLPLDEFTKLCPTLPPNFDPPSPVPGAAGRESTGNWTNDQWRNYLYGYYHYIEMVDAEVGKILTALHDAGLEDNTVIIFSSDHGDGMAAHHTTGKNCLYEEMARVPFIISYQGRTPAGVVNNDHMICNSIDLMPTLCDYAGIATPPGANGRSVRALAEGKAPDTWRDHLIVQCGGEGVPGLKFDTGRMVRTKQYKYTVYHAHKDRDVVEELFDLQKDTGEVKNLVNSPDFATVLSDHKKLLVEWCKETGDPFPVS
jgi:arylsulfatase A-like enzyme